MQDARKFKAARNGFMRGYDLGTMRGGVAMIAVVVLFALLMVANPLKLTYVDIDVYHYTDAYLECDFYGYDGRAYDCKMVEYEKYVETRVYWHWFILAVLVYGISSLLLILVVFWMLFSTKRTINLMDQRLAARETLGLLDKDEEKA